MFHTPSHKLPQSWMSPVASKVPSTFIGTKEVVAWPERKFEDVTANGEPQKILVTEGYAIQYPDGYTSWSPKDAFEAVYRVTDGADQALTFGDALHFLKQGRRVARQCWAGRGIYLGLNAESTAVLTSTDMLTLHPFIYLRDEQDAIVPWLASQGDMLAEDWVLLG